MKGLRKAAVAGVLSFGLAVSIAPNLALATTAEAGESSTSDAVTVVVPAASEVTEADASAPGGADSESTETSPVSSGVTATENTVVSEEPAASAEEPATLQTVHVNLNDYEGDSLATSSLKAGWVEVYLTAEDGTQYKLNYDAKTGDGRTFVSSSIPAGTYTLSLQLSARVQSNGNMRLATRTGTQGTEGTNVDNGATVTVAESGETVQNFNVDAALTPYVFLAITNRASEDDLKQITAVLTDENGTQYRSELVLAENHNPMYTWFVPGSTYTISFEGPENYVIEVSRGLSNGVLKVGTYQKRMYGVLTIEEPASVIAKVRLNVADYEKGSLDPVLIESGAIKFELVAEDGTRITLNPGVNELNRRSLGADVPSGDYTLEVSIDEERYPADQYKLATKTGSDLTGANGQVIGWGVDNGGTLTVPAEDTIVQNFYLRAAWTPLVTFTVKGASNEQAQALAPVFTDEDGNEFAGTFVPAGDGGDPSFTWYLPGSTYELTYTALEGAELASFEGFADGTSITVANDALQTSASLASLSAPVVVPADTDTGNTDNADSANAASSKADASKKADSNIPKTADATPQAYAFAALAIAGLGLAAAGLASIRKFARDK